LKVDRLRFIIVLFGAIGQTVISVISQVYLVISGALKIIDVWRSFYFHLEKMKVTHCFLCLMTWHQFLIR